MTQYHLFFFVLIISNQLGQLLTDQRNNNNCPHLFKTLTDCTCVHTNTIDCSYSTTITHLPRSWKSTNHNLTSFTQSITRFDLIHTPSITSIKTDDFQGLHNLQYLTIVNSGLVNIAPHAFRHLHRLYELRIESNRNLVELKSYSLSDIEYIHRISLKSNSIRIIHSEVFRNTHFVEIIDLTDNPLEIIEAYAFNRLKSIGSLILCSSNTCPIKQIDPSAFFGLHTCDKILLTGIHTPLHTHSFSYMVSIRLVNLSHSNISHIDSYVFQNSENLNEIDLSSSLISTIAPNAFDDLTNVSLLNLKGNLIRVFDKSVFQELNHSIKHIDLDNNPIQCDCTLEWYIIQRPKRFTLPSVCTGPIGYECISPNELQQSQLPCYQIPDENNQTKRKNLCEKHEKDIFVLKSSSVSLYKLTNTFFLVVLALRFANPF